MKKKRSPGSRLFSPTPGPHNPASKCYGIPAADLFLYARSFHTAAKKLADSLRLDGPSADFDVSPVVFMYRHAVELHLKAMVVGQGGNFLATKPDALSVYKTHSVSWLAQFVCQIVIGLKWEMEIRCEGVENLIDFKAIIEEINSVDPGSYVFRFPVSTDGSGSSNIREYARQVDALIILLERTADAMAATWDMRTESAALDAQLNGGNNVEPTIQ